MICFGFNISKTGCSTSLKGSVLGRSSSSFFICRLLTFAKRTIIESKKIVQRCTFASKMIGWSTARSQLTSKLVPSLFYLFFGSFMFHSFISSFAAVHHERHLAAGAEVCQAVGAWSSRTPCGARSVATRMHRH